MDAHDLGLAHDLDTMTAAIKRRRALQWLAALAGAGLASCGGGGDATGTSSFTDTSSDSTTDADSTDSTDSTSCSPIPEETAGPYPADGSNSNLNALALSGVVRSDIRSSFVGATGTAEGVLLTVQITLVDTSDSCADLSGYAIYLWHCDREGRYSMYSSGVTDENYLRGVQQTDSSGVATFTTIFPGCYAGRMPHMHFEVYRDANTATSYTNKLATSQIAFPEDDCATVYATSGYSASVSNFSRISFDSDNVFSDGVTLQLATVTGSVADGYVAALTVGISV